MQTQEICDFNTNITIVSTPELVEELNQIIKPTPAASIPPANASRVSGQNYSVNNLPTTSFSITQEQSQSNLNSNTSRSVVYSNNFNITNNIGIIGHEIQKSKILSSIQSNLAITSTTTTLLLL
jgi:hypothetical protein